jgi:lysophospholipase L1-like esterase
VRSNDRGIDPEGARPGRPSLRRNVAAATVVAISLLAAIAVSELLVRYLWARSERWAIWPVALSQTFHPDSTLLPGVSGPAHFITNEIGLRGAPAEPGQRIRVLALGGSTTECMYLDSSETWTALLSRRLGGPGGAAWVGNGGMSGRSAAHHLTALSRMPLRTHGISIVLVLVGGNDLGRHLKFEGQPPPLEDEELLDQTFTGAGGYHPAPGDRGIRRSALWRLARQVRNAGRAEKGGPTPYTDGTIYARWRANRHASTARRDTLPDLTRGVQEYRSLLERLADVARAREVKLVLMTQPTMWRADLSPAEDSLLWMGGVRDFQHQPGRPYHSARALEAGMRAYNETLLGVCRSKGLACLDLASALPKDTSVFYDDMHFNEQGARLVADRIAEFLAREGEAIGR